jgi:alkylated DNA repair protein alkB family protein 1
MERGSIDVFTESNFSKEEEARIKDRFPNAVVHRGSSATLVSDVQQMASAHILFASASHLSALAAYMCPSAKSIVVLSDTSDYFESHMRHKTNVFTINHPALCQALQTLEHSVYNSGSNDQNVQLATLDSWKRERERFKQPNTEKLGQRQPHIKMNQKVPDTDLSGVIDFSDMFGDEQAQMRAARQGVFRLNSCNNTSSASSSLSYQGPRFGLESRPGFVHCPAALSPSMQVALAKLAKHQYCKPPHTTNQDAHKHRPESKWPRLAWASVGYHFDWTHRVYRDEMQSPFPKELAALTALFARSIGSQTFNAQAAIVNFYRPGSNMGAHVDDSEDDFKNPVVSISLGLPAVFLVGTKNKSDPPVPVLLRNSDVMLLSGDSRLAFHGIAGVLPHPVPLPRGIGPLLHDHAIDLKGIDLFEAALEAIRDRPGDDDEEADVHQFLSRHRINMNVRQVLLDGHDQLVIPKPLPGCT